MELLNLGFAKFIIILTICVLPGILGLYCVVVSEERKRELRNKFCNKLFGVSNAIEYPKFARFLMVVGFLMLLLSAVATWFLFLKDFGGNGN